VVAVAASAAVGREMRMALTVAVRRTAGAPAKTMERRVVARELMLLLLVGVS
jgi:hypothetical protein